MKVESTAGFHVCEKDPGAIVGHSLARQLRGLDGQCGLIEDNLTYGEALGRRIYPLIQEAGGVNPLILNVGDGLGDNSFGMNKFLRAAGTMPQFVHLDLSRTLLKKQKALNPGINPVLGDAHDLPLASDSLDGVVCNEVIADLNTAVFTTNELLGILRLFDPIQGDLNRAQIKNILESRLAETHNINDLVEVVRFFREYNLARPKTVKDKNTKTAINLGAMMFLEETARTIKPKGWIWISEYGNTWPKDVKLPGHREWSIKFGHLIQVAKGLGLEVSINSLARDLGINSNTWFIDHLEEGRYCSLAIADAMRIHPAYYSRAQYVAVLKRHCLHEQKRELRKLAEQFGIQINMIEPGQDVLQPKNGSKVVYLLDMKDQVKGNYSLTVTKPL
jgi:SAM-dependent methyltransferase